MYVVQCELGIVCKHIESIHFLLYKQAHEKKSGKDVIDQECKVACDKLRKNIYTEK